jgi:hypothetical protein
MGTGHYRLRTTPELPRSNDLYTIVNASPSEIAPLYGYGTGPFNGPVWDLFVSDKNGVATDPDYIAVALIIGG